MPETVSIGRTPDDILENSTPGEIRAALALQGLTGELEGVIAEFEYDGNDEAQGFVAACRSLLQYAQRLSIDERTAALTLNRECARCSGAGSVGGEYPCIECDGKRFVRLEA